jgi:PKD repeat protein
MLRPGLVVCALLPLVALSACHTRTLGGDGGLDALGGDAPGADVAGPLAVDFAVTGCATFDVAAESCAGAPPLTLMFSPVSSPSLTRFLWTFGDGSPTSSERASTHTYLLPGTYDVGVVADGAMGSVSRTRASFVSVTALATGAPCDVDAQCAGGSCLCGGGACAPTFPRGVCTAACPAAGCAAGTVCATLEVPAPGAAKPDGGGPAAGDAADARDAPTSSDATARDGAGDTVTSDAAAARDAPTGDAPAGPSDAAASDTPVDSRAQTDAAADASAGNDAPQGAGTDAGAADGAGPTPTALCLASCTTDKDCAGGLVCRAVPAAAAAPPRWTRACVPPSLRDLGDSCRDATGALADALCATDACADLGALGLCSATCGVGEACPSGSACATFADGRSLCVVSCAVDVTCTSDPLLDCEAAGGLGALSFQVSPPAPATTFCAPRVCTSQADCGPSGTCKPLGVGAHCARN